MNIITLKVKIFPLKIGLRIKGCHGRTLIDKFFLTLLASFYFNLPCIIIFVPLGSTLSKNTSELKINAL